MGVHVRERNGAWWVFVTHRNRRKAKKVGSGEQARKVALELANRITIRLAYGEDIDPPKKGAPTFADYAEEWLRNVKVLMKISTWEVYERHMRRTWVPALGKKRLDQITRGDVKRVLIQLQKTQSFSRVYLLSMLTAL
jgi:Phage integrase, N-terminal SAM-like domain